MTSLRSGRRLGQSGKCSSQAGHRCIYFAAQLVPFGEPSRIIVGKPGLARFIPPDQNLERQINADRLGGLHKRRAAFGIAKDQEVGGA